MKTHILKLDTNELFILQNMFRESGPRTLNIPDQIRFKNLQRNILSMKFSDGFNGTTSAKGAKNAKNKRLAFER